MCGIVGKISFNSFVSEESILKMSQKIVYRGPDDGGVYTDGHVGLGSRRLAILDLSDSGHMPMVSSDGKTVIVYNGEVYNYRDYWDELKDYGFDLKSKTDTEVILYLYKKYGVECLQKLRGMFAFVIYDKENNVIFGARDRFGQKPFKYYSDDNYFIFASELKAILENVEVEKKIDYQAVSDFLTYQFVPCPSTGFENIKKLPPAHYFILDLKTKVLDIKRYWQADYSTKLDLSVSEWRELILEKLEESVKLRMISDVPLGAFLSGGVDSSAIVAMMAKNSSRPIQTFAMGFDEKSFDERAHAKIIADKFCTEHHEMVLKPNAIMDLPKLIYHYEEPYGDSSMLPTYYLSKFTKEYVTVALNGDAGDENFAGYSRYNMLRRAMLFRNIPKSIRSLGRGGLYYLSRYVLKTEFLSKCHKFAQSVENDPIDRYMHYIYYFNAEDKNNMYKPDSPIANLQDSAYHLRKVFGEATGTDLLDKILYTDVNSYLPDDLLVKVDIATMSQSLEARSPLLDHKFFELTSQIPSSLKLQGSETKYIFKKSLEGILPNDILYRKKMGFGVPAGAWFKNELKDYFIDTVIENSCFIHKIIRKEYLKQEFDRHLKGGGGEGRRLWLLLVLELWYREFFM